MSHKILLTITTCNRLSEVRKYVLPYINFCNNNSSYYFLLSLDGDNQEYLKFCDEFQIPLLYSQEREGVGLSKNRVLKQFPDFDYYFFIEDDIELIDESVFNKFVKMFELTNYHHFSYSHVHNPIRLEEKSGLTLIHSNFGGGQINFYTKFGLEKVGGWNTYFAKYKRFGHTEHTYRYYHAGLTPSPFIFIKEARNMFIIHDPPHVTKIETVLENPSNELIPEEEDMIYKKTVHFPLATLSPFNFNGQDMKFSRKVEVFLQMNKGKYPLLKGKEKRHCYSEYFFFKFSTTDSFFKKSLYFNVSFILHPLNNQIKHYIKQLIGLV